MLLPLLAKSYLDIYIFVKIQNSPAFGCGCGCFIPESNLTPCGSYVVPKQQGMAVTWAVSSFRTPVLT